MCLFGQPVSWGVNLTLCKWSSFGSVRSFVFFQRVPLAGLGRIASCVATVGTKGSANQRLGNATVHLDGQAITAKEVRCLFCCILYCWFECDGRVLNILLGRD